MSRSSVLVCGEALFDFFQTSQSDDPKQSDYQAVIGGSPYNVAMGLSRLGVGSAFFAGISTDVFGTRLRQAIKSEYIHDWALIKKSNHTTLSFIALDDEGSPEYAFFNENAADISLTKDDIPILPAETKMIHSGSYSLVVQPTADTILSLMQQNKDHFISIDPNIRPTVEGNMQIWADQLKKLVPLANLVKVSTEDLEFMDARQSPLDVARDWLSQGPDMVIVTDGGSKVTALTHSGDVSFSPNKIDVIDTVGAGDTFMAATLYFIEQNGFVEKGLHVISEEQQLELLQFASKAAAITCQRRGADLPHLSDIQ